MSKIRGVIVATVTPFTKNGEKVALDWIPAHLEYLRKNGADAVLISGTNGEGPSLSLAERRAVIETVLANRGDLGVMAGTGCSALPETIELSRYALGQGADAVLVVPPFYFKGLSDKGLIEYYGAIFNSLPSDGKVALYNIPKLSGVEITDPVIEALLERYPSMLLGVKDTSGSIDQTRHFIERFPELSIFSGTDLYVEQAALSGAKGNVSAAANVFPHILKSIFHSVKEGKPATSTQDRLSEIRRTLDRYPSHSAIKHALGYFAGLPLSFVRPPLRDLTPSEAEEAIGSLTAILADAHVPSPIKV